MKLKLHKIKISQIRTDKHILLRTSAPSSIMRPQVNRWVVIAHAEL